MSKSEFFTTKVWVNRTTDEAFEFFSDLNNLVLLTPRLMNMNIDNSYLQERVNKDTSFEIKIGYKPFILKWQSEITDWNPSNYFSDQQTSGPYSKWIHKHSFTEGEGGTWIIDEVEYKPKLFPFVGKIFYKLLLKSMFSYRDKQVKKLMTN